MNNSDIVTKTVITPSLKQFPGLADMMNFVPFYKLDSFDAKILRLINFGDFLSDVVDPEDPMESDAFYSIEYTQEINDDVFEKILNVIFATLYGGNKALREEIKFEDIRIDAYYDFSKNQLIALKKLLKTHEPFQENLSKLKIILDFFTKKALRNFFFIDPMVFTNILFKNFNNKKSTLESLFTNNLRNINISTILNSFVLNNLRVEMKFDLDEIFEGNATKFNDSAIVDQYFKTKREDLYLALQNLGTIVYNMRNKLATVGAIKTMSFTAPEISNLNTTRFLFREFGNAVLGPLYENMITKVIEGFPKLDIFEQLNLSDVTQGPDLIQLRKYLVFIGLVEVDPIKNDVDNINLVPTAIIKKGSFSLF